MARECIFRASGGTRFKNFCQPLGWKERGRTTRCNRSAQKNSGYVTDGARRISAVPRVFWGILINVITVHLSGPEGPKPWLWAPSVENFEF